ncbi:MAG: anaerobic carbon-monoxide dehydrogenase catalytic subunit [Deferribacteres bacterium]|nr:anaerobic carbon-monoxide dehydrogenase catalytic subunit [Deferribacteres bacterium]
MSDQGKSTDSATLSAIGEARKAGIETVWDRYQAQVPQCGFGETGLCCRHCLQGPCRIDPFGEGARTGVCGADADVMVARGLSRAIAAGAASHGGHAKHLAHTLLKSAKGEAGDYPLKDEAKLRAVAGRIGIKTEGREAREIAVDVAEKALQEFSEKESPLVWAATTVTKGRVETFLKLGVVPQGIDSTVAESMHRTTYGVDADPVNILLGAVKCALADYAACHMATDIADILFGTPQPVVTRANLGVIKSDSVNIALHGHNPLLSDIIVQVAGEQEMNELAVAAGASGGINIVGVCCTGNEVMMRHRIPLATSSVSQETAILTGALDAMVVDYQCIMPALAGAAECYHTQLITTMPIAKIPNALHIGFSEAGARDCAKEIIRAATDAFKKRDPARINIPGISSAAFAGFSTEAILSALSLVDKDDPLKPITDNIASGNIYGVCLFAGCNNVKITQDANYTAMITELVKNNVLILATGCASGAFARHGFMTPEATEKYAGDGLKAVLTAVGQAAGLNGPLPLVLHMGSCVDNSRAADIAVAIADKLGVDLNMLPVVASAPEPVTEKAVAIGTWAVAAGLPTHLGIVPPVLGSRTVTEVLTSTAKELFGGYFIVETDPLKAAEKLLSVLGERRRGLGLGS